MSVKIQFKRGSADIWQTKNPVLDAGEPGYEIDTGKIKVGDGQTHWNDLEYIFDPELPNVEDQTLLDKIKNVDGSGSGLDADLLDGLDSGQFVRSDVDDEVNGKLSFRKSIHVTGSNVSRITAVSNNGAIELTGGTSSAILSVQDGNGRIQLKWNATHGTNETFLVGSENAAMWEFDPYYLENQLFTIYYADGSSANAGDSITWQNILRIGTDEFTYKEYNVWHEGNDGSGSGLDADLLDGLDSSQFLRSDINDETIGTLTIHKKTPGLYLRDTKTGYEAATHLVRYQGKFEIQYRDYDLNYIASPLVIYDSCIVQLRGENSDWYISGHKIWHEGNDGSGSGLDADLWDGGHKHISTSDPSGGSDGDVWFKIED